MTSLGNTKQKKACILQDSMIPGKNIESKSAGTFWKCMAACWKSESCKVGSYVPNNKRCYLKAEFEPQAKKTTWSITNKVKSFDFTCSVSVKDISKEAPAPVEKPKTNSRTSRKKKKSKLTGNWRSWNIVKTLKSINKPLLKKEPVKKKKTEPLCVYKGAIYPDGTINSETKDTAEGCAILCAGTQDCVIATYVGTNNKCILKGKKHKPLTRTDWASDNRVITYDFENKCVGVRPKSARRAAKDAELENDARDGKAPCRYHNVVLAGGTFFSADAESIKQCSDLCLKKAQCSAVTFLQEQGRCHVKNKKHKGPLFSKFAVDNGAISLDYRCNRKAYHSFLKKLPAERKIHGIRQACRYKNRRIAGEVVERIDLVTEHECGTACLSSHDCFGIIYRLSSMTCYLKSESHNGPMSTETPGVVSYDFTLDCVPEGKKEGKAPPLVKVIEHLDMVYRGPILRTVLSIETAEDCVEICSKNPKCKAATYISIPTSTKCFLRGKNHGRLYPLKSTGFRKVVTYDLDCDKNNKPNRPTSEQPCLLSAKVFTGGFLETKSGVKSPEECFNKCSSVKLCVAATYAPMTKKCFLRDSSREGPKMTEYAVKNKVISYDFLCARKSGEDKFTSNKQNTVNDKSSPNAVTDQSKQSCTFEGQVFTGGFLESKTGVVTSKECFNHCSTLQGCVTATFAPKAQKCFLRDSSREGPITTVFASTNKLLSHDFLCDREIKKDGRTLPDKDITKAAEGSAKTSDVEKKSAEATSKRSCWLKGHVFTGGFLETKTDVESAKECFDYCSAMEDCVAATYAPNTKKCFLRDSSREDPTKTDFAAENNLVSYDFLCQKTFSDKSGVTPKKKTESTEQKMPKQPCYLRGKVFTGGFLETKIGLATPKECSEYCSSLTSCVAATYVPNAKKCFLRDSSREDPVETVYATTNKVVSYDFLCNGEKVVPNKEKPPIVDKKFPVDKKSCILKGQVFENGLIEVIDSFATATSCSEECFTVDKCVSASYCFKTKKCYLRDKNRVGPIEKPGFISYDKSCLKDAGVEKENKANSNKQKQTQPKNFSSMNNDEPCVLQGMIFTDGFLETVQNVQNALSCSEECSMDDDCVAATYNLNKKTCRLMNDNREGPKKMSGVVSFDFLCKKRPNNPKQETPKYEKHPIRPANQEAEISGKKSAENDQPCVLMGQLFNGGFLETISSVGAPLSCSEECAMNEDCATATYNVKLKTCRLMDKTRVGPKKLPGVISFNFLCSKESGTTDKINDVSDKGPVKKESKKSADDEPCVLQGQFFSGGYLETINFVGKPIDCSEECSMDENCAAASYNFKMKTCRLMDKNREGPKKMAGVVSFDFTCKEKSTATKSQQDHKKAETTHPSEKVSHQKTENFSGDSSDEVVKKSAKNDQPCVIQGQSFTGGFLETIKAVKNPLSCSEECSMDENCAAASYSWKFKSCRLMDRNRASPKKMPGVVSFDFLCRVEPENSMNSEPSKSKPPPKPEATRSCLLNGQVFNGGFLKTLIGVTSAKSCFEKCSMDKQCVTATYVPKTKSCSLRNRFRTGPKKTDYATANNVVSYDFLCDEPTSDIKNEIEIGDSKVSNDSLQKEKSCVLQGQSYTGGFLEIIPSVKSPLSCSDECLMDENCVTATYNIKIKSCRLMNANRVGPKKMPGVVSFDFLCKAEDNADSKLLELSEKDDKKGTKNGSPCAFQGQSFSGGFLETVNSVDDPLSCSDECLMDENCASATYNIKMKTCRLMDKTRNGPKKQPGVVSFDFLCKKNMVPPAQNEKDTDINKGGDSKVTFKESNSKRPCTLKGQVFTGGFLETKTGVASPQKCSEHCSSNTDCVAATYAPHSKSCFLRDSSRDDPKETAFAAKNEVVSFDFLCANAVPEQKSMSYDETNRKSTSENLPQSGGKIDKSCLLTGQVFTGGFLETKSDISSMRKCVEICANLEGCAALTYSPNNKGCFLRDSSREGPKKTEFAAKNGVVSYDLTCGQRSTSQASPAGKPAPREPSASGKSTDCLMKNKVFTGGFLERKTDVSSSAKCFELCSENKDCVTATFAPNAKNCFLRDSSREGPQETEFATKNNMISYDFSCETKINENGIKAIKNQSSNELEDNKLPTDDKQPCVFRGQIYTGGFLETKKGISSPAKCSEICSINNECATATYAPNTKSCFLKDDTRKGPQVTDFATKNKLVSYDFLCNRGTEQNVVQKSEKISVKTIDKGMDFNRKQQCTLRGQVFTGGFLETKTEISSQEECFEMCSENKDCVTATHAPKTKSCFLRDSSREGPKATDFAAKNNMISYDFLCEKKTPGNSASVIKQASEKESSSSSSRIESCLLHGQIYSGGFLETKTEVSSQGECFKMCSENKDCVTATYAPNKKSCLLRDSTRKGPEKTEFAIENKIISYDFLCEEKAKKKSEVTSSENVSGVDASEKPCMLQGQVFNGGFLETVKNVESPLPCSEECLMDEDCVTATYNFKLKTCRLMNKNREGPKKLSGVVSFDFLCQDKKQATNAPKDSKKLPLAEESNSVIDTVDSDKEIEDTSGDKAEPCVLQGQVFTGGFLETVNSVEEPLSCSEECSMDENCFAASYNARMKTCRLMDKTRQGPRKMPGALSFDFLCKQSSSVSEIEPKEKPIADKTAKQSCLLSGKVFTGGFLEKKSDITSSKSCFDTCKLNEECAAATFAPNTKSCFLRDSLREGPVETVFATTNKLVSYDFKCEEDKSSDDDGSAKSQSKDKSVSVQENSVDASENEEACILQGRTFTGGFLETITSVETPISCSDECLMDQDCVTVSYNFKTKACRLMNKDRVGPKAQSGIVSFDFTCKSSQEVSHKPDQKNVEQVAPESDTNDQSDDDKPCFLQSQSFTRGFLETVAPVDNPLSCSDECLMNEDCASATYNIKMKTCRLMDKSRTGPKKLSGVVSFDFLCKKKSNVQENSIESPKQVKTPQQTASKKPCVLNGQVFTGGFLETKKNVETSEKCSQLCSSNNECEAASYAPNTKSCFLRDSTRVGPTETAFATKNKIVSFDFGCGENVSKLTDDSKTDTSVKQTAEPSSTNTVKESTLNQACYFAGQVFTGGYLETKKGVESAEKCFELCSSSKECTTATFAPNTKSCFLRDSSREGPQGTEFAIKNSMVSYDFKCEEEVSKKTESLNDNISRGDAKGKTQESIKPYSSSVESCTLHGQIFSGGFLETKTEVSSQEECFKMCSESKNCVTATYAPNAESCFLRDSTREGPKATDFAAKNNMISYDFLCEREASAESASVIEETPEEGASGKTSQKAGASSNTVESCLLHGQIFSGGFLETKTEVSSQEECFKMCSENKDCVTATYAPNAESCFLRDSSREGPKVTEFAAKNNMISYDFLCEREASAESASVIEETPEEGASGKTSQKAGASSNTVESCLLHGQIFSGGFLETKTEVSSQEECFKMCSENKDCVTATYAPNAESCFLRDSSREGPKVTEFAAKNNMISYDFLCEREASAESASVIEETPEEGASGKTSQKAGASSNTVESCLLHGQIFSGGFLETKTEVSSQEECFKMCSENKDCVTATYAPNAKSCFLRDSSREGPKVTDFASMNNMISYDFLCEKQTSSKSATVMKETSNEAASGKTSKKDNSFSSSVESCTLHGQIFSGGFLETKTEVSSQEECFKMCSENKDCVTATYAPNAKSCFLRDSTREGPKSTDFAAKNNMISYDFLCEKEASQAAAKKEAVAETNAEEKVSEVINESSRKENPCTLQGQIFSGGFIETKKDVLSSEKCFEMCSKNKDCVTATYAPNTKSCFLRDESREGPQVTEFATENNMISHDFLCEKQASVKKDTPVETNENVETSKSSSKSKKENPCTLQGQIFSGGFIETKKDVLSSEKCFEMCSQNKDCVTATYAPNTKSCFLRDSSREGPQETEFAKSNEMISFDFLCENQAAAKKKAVADAKPEEKVLEVINESSRKENPCTLQGQIFSGGFIETKKDVPSSEKCFEMCSQNKDCVTATYAPNTKSCFLRDESRGGPQVTEFATENNMISHDFLCEKQASVKKDAPVETNENEETSESSSAKSKKENPCTLQGQIFSGGFIETKNGISSSERCFEVCAQHQDCVTATYAPNTKSCLLRDESREGPQVTVFATENNMISHDFLCDEKAGQKTEPVDDDVEDRKSAEKSPGSEQIKNEQPCVLQGHAYTKGFLETVQNVETALSCSEDCLMHDDCVAASYNFKMKTCRLMSKERSGPVKTPGVVSFDFLCKENRNTNAPNTESKVVNGKEEKTVEDNSATTNTTNMDVNNPKDQPCILYGQAFNGGFLETVNSVESPLSCSEECLMDDDCVAASFNVKKKTCRLMDKTKLVPEKMPGVVSFDFLCRSGSVQKSKNTIEDAAETKEPEETPPVKSCLLKGQVFTGGFLATENDIESSEICFEECRSNIDCAAVTYAPNTKSCFLRDSSREGPTETVFASTNGMVSYDFLCDGKVSRQNEMVKDENIADKAGIEIPLDELNGSRSEKEEPPISPPFTNISADESMRTPSNSSQQLNDERKNKCLLIGKVFTGGFLKKLEEFPSSEECFETCSLDEECFAVTYQPKTRNCFLRDSSRDQPLKTDFAVTNKIVSYDFLCEGKFIKEVNAESRKTDQQSSEEDSPCILHEQLFQDGLLEVIDSVQSASACSEDCSMDESCAAASYSSETKKCYLRDSRRTGPIVRPHFTSFDFSCQNNVSKSTPSGQTVGEKKEGCVMQGYMYTGGLIELLSNVCSAEDCFEECSMMEDCVAATFSPKSRKCLLRNAERRGPIATYFSKLSGLVSIDFLCSNEVDTQETKDDSDPCIFNDAYFIGGLIDSMDSVKSADDCFEECSMDDACSVATYNPVSEECFMRDNLRRGPVSSAFARENKLISYDFACRHSNSSVDKAKKIESPELYTLNITSNSTKKGKFPCRIQGQAFTGRTLEILENVLKGSDCSEECAMDSLCVSATYFPTTLKCYLRDNSRNGPVETARSIADKVISYDYTCDPNMVRTTFSNSTGRRTQQSDDGREYCVFKRKSLSGSTLTVKQGLPSPNDCMMSCSSEKLCVAATYNPMNRKCILRSDKGPASSTAYAIYNNIVSFDFQCKEQTETVDHQTPSKEPCRLPGMFFSGEILTKIVNVTEETDCVKFCLDTEDCAVGTFNPVLKTCILRDKNRNQATKSESSVIHGVVSFDLLCDADDAATKEAVMKSKNPCRYVGNVFPGPALKIYSDLENEVGCLEKCETTGDCVAVTYNPTSERCVLKDEFRGDPVATENAALDMIVSYDFLCNAASASDVASTSETSSEPVTSEKDLEQDDTANDTGRDDSETSEESKANKGSSNSEGNVSEAPHTSKTSPVAYDVDDLAEDVFDSDRQHGTDEDTGASHDEPSDNITTKSEDPCRLPNTFFNGAAVSIIQDVDDEQICLKKCREADDCFVVTYNPTQKKCLLKDRNARISSTSDNAIAAKIVSYDFLCNEATYSDGSSPDLENIEPNTESSEQNKDVSSNFFVKDNCRLPGQYFPGVAMEIIRGIDNEHVCFSQCFKSTACIAVTFDPSANKCVLKDEIGDPPLEHTLNPNVVSYDFTCSGKEEIIDSENEHSHAAKQEVPSGAKCRLFGAFFPGPDGAMKILPNLKDESACFLECADTDECVAVTFNPTTNKCVLKDKDRREPVTNARAVKEKVVSFDFVCNGKSASAWPTKSESGPPISKKKLETPCILKNQLFSGRYLSALTQIESGDECMKKCATIKKCLVATYIDSTKRCYLRDENHGEMETSMWAVDNGAISWDFACSSQPSEMPPDEVLSLPVGSVCRFDNAFFPGGTIKIIDNVASPKECAAKCKHEDKCEAFTFVVKESSCTLKCDLREDPVSTPWAVHNGAFSFLMEYCNDDDFSTESFDPGFCLNKKFAF